uniref:BTB domain-containing protein n=1 Tax=Panagrolaimus superbus TaxID=310955 RepID=A0A914YZB0_9BILA
MQAHEVKEVNKHSRKLKQIVCAQTEADLRTILDHLYRKIHSNSILFEQNRRRSKNALYFGKQAISSLFYFTRCKGRLCACHVPSEAECESKIYDWLRIILHFVDHRYGMHVDQQDVLQAARLLLSNADCPPYSVDLVISSPSLPGYISETKKKRHDIGMALLLTSDTEFLKDAYNLLGPQKHKAFNDYGLTALSQAVITKNDEAVSFLIENNADVNAAIPPDNNSQSSALSNEFSGWSPLAWAVAFQDIFATNKLLEAGADVDEIYMIQETPLKIATMIGDSETFAKLISSGSNAFNTSKCYDSLQCTIRNLGSPSALAVAAAFGRREFVSIMLSQSRLSDSSKNDLSLTDFLNEYNTDIRSNEIYASGENNVKSSSFKKLPKIIQKASQEAVYYAVETARSDIVMQFKQLGVPWNIYTWTKCLQVGYDNHDRTTMMNVLKDFSSRLIDELTADIVDDTVAILFDVIRYETRQSDGKPVVIAKIISKLNEKFSRDNSDSISQSNRSISVIESGTSSTSISAKPIIDPKYADNSELSDIRFKIEDKIIFAHRIVLVNASESFKRILDGPSGVIELDNISYDVFKVLINYMYGNRNICRQKMSENGLFFLLDIMEASLTFGLDHLTQECHDLINSEMSSESCSRIYSFAQRCGIQTLIEDAENYILQNFVTLMNNEQILLMLQRSGQPGWCDLCAALANRLVESFETFISRNKQI